MTSFKTHLANLALIAFLLIGITASAQSPQALNYQAVARDATGAALVNQTVNVKLSVLDITSTGATVYQETHSGVTTNPFGLFTVEVGNGAPNTGVFSSINWGNGAKFLKVEVDFNNVGAYTDMGTSQLLSVPYALYAASSASSPIAINDLTDVNTAGVAVNQVLKWDGTNWVPSNDIGGGTGDNWGTQTVVADAPLTGNGTSSSHLKLTNGTTNGQVLKWNGTAWAAGTDANTDAQTLSIAGTTLTISGGNNVTLPTGTTYTAGTGIGITGNVISNTGDLSTTNEIQSLSLAGNSLSISSGNNVTLPTGTTYTAGTGITITGTTISSPAQTLSISGSTLSISGGNSVTLPGGSGSGWSLTGNSGTTAANFIGTTDNQPLRFKVNSLWAGELNATSNNVSLGVYAGDSYTSATNNTAIGTYALQASTTGGNNTAVGNGAMYTNTIGNENTAVGFNALYYNTSGIDNTAIGYAALNDNTTGTNNVATGLYALRANTNGTYNTAVGTNALQNNTTASRNTAVGFESMNANTTGVDNVALGYQSLYANTTGIENTAAGYGVLNANTTGSYNTGTGLYALHANTTADYNTANGNYSLYSNTTGTRNTAVGYSALYTNTTGNENVAIGLFALRSNTTGNRNIAIGNNALFSTSTASSNIAIGDSALFNMISGFSNTAIGRSALIGNTDNNNTAVGVNALRNTLNPSSGNTAVGRDAGNMETWIWPNFSNCTFLGYLSKTNMLNLDNATALGYNTTVSASYTVRIGSPAVFSIGGYAGWSNVSDGRYKKNVNENVPGLNFISKLKPITYSLDVDGIDRKLNSTSELDQSPESRSQHDIANLEKSKIVYSGFIAQDVEKAAKELGYDFSGVDAPQNDESLYGLRYAEFVVPLVKAVQEQQVMIEQLQKQNEELMKRISTLEQK